jgi:hypothetical protein
MPKQTRNPPVNVNEGDNDGKEKKRKNDVQPGRGTLYLMEMSHLGVINNM